jgi:hypothetical protein
MHMGEKACHVGHSQLLEEACHLGEGSCRAPALLLVALALGSHVLMVACLQALLARRVEAPVVA